MPEHERCLRRSHCFSPKVKSSFMAAHLDSHLSKKVDPDEEGSCKFPSWEQYHLGITTPRAKDVHENSEATAQSLHK